MKERTEAFLLLADGTLFDGESIGAAGTSIGEVVFTTGMTGYQETLTDPSYFGQIVTQTFPLIGNYGINSFDSESKQVYAKGYIVREICDEPSNFRSSKSLDGFLTENGVVGIAGIDTRHLTKMIREYGVINGALTTENMGDGDKRKELLSKISGYSIKDAVESVSVHTYKEYKKEGSKYKVALMDFGYKKTICNSLIERGCDVTVVPCTTTANGLSELSPDGIMLSNGPGDPAENVQIIENVADIVKLGIPTFGICLGHQIVALSQGGETRKLKYGHRGANQPVKELSTGRVYITTQNHGYEVISGSVDRNAGVVSHVNVNDKSCEGMYYSDKLFTVQFHPEACAGPLDSKYLFDEFVGKVAKYKKEA